MKKMMITTLFVLCACAGANVHARSTSTEDVERTIRSFATAGDKQDTAAFEAVLAPAARQFYKKGEKLEFIDTPTYLGLIRAKKIGGGGARAVTVSGIQVHGDMASARARFQSSALQFDNMISLMRIDGRWRIVSIVLAMQKRG